jgi:GT2 family glycosyltransferase
MMVTESGAGRWFLPFWRLYLRLSDSLWSGLNPHRLVMTIRGRVFDEDWYVAENPDLADHEGDYATHYYTAGIFEGRRARFFDARWYFQTHDDLRGSRIDGWTHYKKFGRAEKRVARFFYVESRIDRPQLPDYNDWIFRYDRNDADEATVLQTALPRLKDKAAFSLLLPFDTQTVTETAHRCLEALAGQVYGGFECLIGLPTDAGSELRALAAEAATDARCRVVDIPAGVGPGAALNRLAAAAKNAWITALSADDILAPAALFWLAEAIGTHPDKVIFYADEDRMEVTGERSAPTFKPDFNYELLLTHNYLGDLTVWRAADVAAVGGFDQTLTEDVGYDLTLRLIERIGGDQIHHVARVLNHVRAQRPETLHNPAIVSEHIRRTGGRAEVMPHPEVSGYTRVRHALPEPLPLVTIIIPTRDRVELLKQCLDSVFEKTAYPNYEIIIIDNGSVERATLAYFRTLDPQRVRILRDERPFNFSALNNGAVAEARGEFVCLMNNDIGIMTPDWLEEMLSFAARPDTGAVGARLWYPDDRLQHAGVLVGFFGVAGHMHKMLARGETGYGHRAALHQSLSAVTAAVLLVRKSIYEAVGGFDETLAVAFNDVDFCLKVRDAGYRNIYTPHAEMYHYESASRGAETTPAQKAREFREITLMKARYGEALVADPAFNPNLSLTSEDLTFAFPPRMPTAKAWLYGEEETQGARSPGLWQRLANKFRS